MQNVISTVNFIKSNGLNHRPFRAFLEDIDSNYDDIVYYSHIRWLSRESLVKRFWVLREEIMIFMDDKGKDISFRNDDDWVNDLSFMTKYLFKLNIKL